MAKKAATKTTTESSSTTELKEDKRCGLVMPISAIDDCTEQHWTDVRVILSDAIKSEGFEPNLVSDADDISVIHKRIVQNLYDNPIVVCDLSHRNPNVMFELGMRLAFDMPVVIVMDDRTRMPFDTGPIEYISYPRDLRYNTILQFKKKLGTKLTATYKKAQEQGGHFGFLQQFGEFTLAKIEKNEVANLQEYLEMEFDDIRGEMRRLTRPSVNSPTPSFISASERLTRVEAAPSYVSRYDTSQAIAIEATIDEAVADAVGTIMTKVTPEQLSQFQDVIASKAVNALKDRVNLDDDDLIRRVALKVELLISKLQ